MNQTFNVYAKIKHTDGQIEERRLWLENFTTREEAERYARSALRCDPDMVLRAWVEAVPAKESKQ